MCVFLLLFLNSLSSGLCQEAFYHSINGVKSKDSAWFVLTNLELSQKIYTCCLLYATVSFKSILVHFFQVKNMPVLLSVLDWQVYFEAIVMSSLKRIMGI